MKFIVSLLFSLFLLEPVLSQSTLYLSIVTLVPKDDVSSAQYQSINANMNADNAILNTEVSNVSRTYQSKFAGSGKRSKTRSHGNWNLRGRDLQSCNPCSAFPTGYWCWYNGVRRPACRREERALTIHKELDATELSVMSEDDRQRHLQAADMCAEATADVVQIIEADISSGKITAPLSAFMHECMYEVA